MKICAQNQNDIQLFMFAQKCQNSAFWLVTRNSFRILNKNEENKNQNFWFEIKYHFLEN